MQKIVKAKDTIPAVEIGDKIVGVLDEVAGKLEVAKGTVELLKAQLQAAQEEEGTLETELMTLLNLTEENGKWLAETYERIIKISAWSQRKAIPYKKMYELVYGKLAPQIKKVVDVEISKLREQAGEIRRVEVDVLKKGGSIWATIQEAWEKVKGFVGGIIQKMIDGLRRILIGRIEIDNTLEEIENIMQENVGVVEACKEISEKLQITADCEDRNERDIVMKIGSLGNTGVEEELKVKYKEKLATIRASKQRLEKVDVKIHSPKSAFVNDVLVVGNTEEEMLETLWDEVEKQCKCRAAAEQLVAKAVLSYRKAQMSKKVAQSWSLRDMWRLIDEEGSWLEVLQQTSNWRAFEELMDEMMEERNLTETLRERQMLAKEILKEEVSADELSEIIERNWEEYPSWWVAKYAKRIAQVENMIVEEQAVEEVVETVGDIVVDVSEAIGDYESIFEEGVEEIVHLFENNEKVSKHVLMGRKKKAMTLDEAIRRKDELAMQGKSGEIREVTVGEYEVVVVER